MRSGHLSSTAILNKTCLFGQIFSFLPAAQYRPAHMDTHAVEAHLDRLAKSESAPPPSYVIQHTHIATGLSYDALIRAFERELGHLDHGISQRLVERRAAWSEVEYEIERVTGPHGLTIIARLDLGALSSLSDREKRCSLYLVGNPVIANEIISVDLRGSFYVPFRVALYDDGGTEGAVISYDRPSSFLATLGHPELAEIGDSLDRKIDAVAVAVRTI
jgi:uncharacterized protein (DUF302 family)